MRLQTVHYRVIACLCGLILHGCASPQVAHFSVPPETNQRKINAISKAAVARSGSTPSKTSESVKSDQIRVTGFNKQKALSREKQLQTEQFDPAPSKVIEKKIDFNEDEDFQSIELIEAEVMAPIEAPKPERGEVRSEVVLQLPPATEVVLSKDNVVFQTEKPKAEHLQEPHLVELGLKPLNQLSVTAKPPAGDLPQNTAAVQLEKLPHRKVVMGESRNWSGVTKEWEAPGVAYNPLYFEEPYLERYGYNYGIIQPFLSAGRFFGRIPALPYMIGAYPMDECRYPLGYEQPGECPPYQVEKLPFSPRGVLFESLTVTGLVFLIP